MELNVLVRSRVYTSLELYFLTDLYRRDRITVWIEL